MVAKEVLIDVFTRHDIVQVLFGVLLSQVAIFSSPSTPPPSGVAFWGFAAVTGLIFLILFHFQGPFRAVTRIFTYLFVSISVASILNAFWLQSSLLYVLANFGAVFSETAGLAIIMGIVASFAVDVLKVL